MNTKRIILYIALAVAILLPYGGLIIMKSWYDGKVNKIRNAEFIVIDKTAMTLTLYDYSGAERMSFPIACGRNLGDKQARGDMRTPEGVFHISGIEDASGWTHDFNDGKGEIPGAYGPWFLRLDTPGHKGIGIHGTHLPESIGTRATEGCIRLKNEDIAQLKEKAYPGMTVVVIPSTADAKTNADTKQSQSNENM